MRGYVMQIERRSMGGRRGPKQGMHVHGRIGRVLHRISTGMSKQQKGAGVRRKWEYASIAAEQGGDPELLLAL